MILLIRNCVNHHYECVESVIVKYFEITKQKADMIYLELSDCREPSFKKYILEKYKNIIYGKPKNYDYFIDVTVHKKPKLIKSKTNFYINHDPNDSYLNLENVFYASPFYTRNIVLDILPFANERQMNENYPIYIIQGSKDVKRRDFNLLDIILSVSYDKKYVIRWNGKGKLPSKYNIYKEKGILEETSGDFIEFHRNFLDCYCLIPLISKSKNPDYYSKKLTSSINYAKGYKLKCLLDLDLQNIYNLKDVEVYDNYLNLKESFKNTLNNFYLKKFNT